MSQLARVYETDPRLFSRFETRLGTDRAAERERKQAVKTLRACLRAIQGTAAHVCPVLIGKQLPSD